MFYDCEPWWETSVIENPKTALMNEGFTSADSFVVRADKNNQLSIHPQAASDELGADDLKAIAGGQCARPIRT